MVRIEEAAYRDVPTVGTGHRPLYIDLIILNLLLPAATMPDDTLPRYQSYPKTTTGPRTRTTWTCTPSVTSLRQQHS